MTTHSQDRDLGKLDLPALIAALRPHGTTPVKSVQALLARGDIGEQEANRVMQRLADAAGSALTPLVRR